MGKNFMEGCIAQYGDRNQYSNWHIISKWLPIKAKEKSNYPWDGGNIPTNIELVLQESPWLAVVKIYLLSSFHRLSFNAVLFFQPIA